MAPSNQDKSSNKSPPAQRSNASLQISFSIEEASATANRSRAESQSPSSGAKALRNLDRPRSQAPPNIFKVYKPLRADKARPQVFNTHMAAEVVNGGQGVMSRSAVEHAAHTLPLLETPSTIGTEVLRLGKETDAQSEATGSSSAHRPQSMVNGTFCTQVVAAFAKVSAPDLPISSIEQEPQVVGLQNTSAKTEYNDIDMLDVEANLQSTIALEAIDPRPHIRMPAAERATRGLVSTTPAGSPTFSVPGPQKRIKMPI